MYHTESRMLGDVPKLHDDKLILMSLESSISGR